MPDGNERPIDNPLSLNSQEKIKQYLTTIGPCRDLSYTTSIHREAIITTDHGIVLNEFLLPRFFIQNDPTIPIIHAEWNNDILLFNLDQALRNKKIGRPVLAHEFGHIFANDQHLTKERDELVSRIMIKDTPTSEKITWINRIAEIDLERELHAWDNASEMAEFLGVDLSDLELTKKLALDGHFYKVLKNQLWAFDFFIGDFVPDVLVSVFDPYLGEKVEMKYKDLQKKVLDSEKKSQAAYEKALVLSK